MTTVSVIGIGKLGLPMIACLAGKGYQVIGVDINKNIIKEVNEGRNPYFEPGLDEMVATGHENISATDDYQHAIKNSEVSFIIVPTPSKSDGSFETKYVEAAIVQIARELKVKNDFHLVVVTSTVLPGATNGIFKKTLEKISGKQCGQDFGLCYSPEFIALGSVVRNFLNPDVVLIGESDPKSGEMLSGIYRTVCENNPPIVRTSIHNAELAKISLNAYVTMKITFANTLAELAEKIPGGDSEAISQVLGFDTRIGRKYLNGGLSYGGPCFPRDNKAFYSVAHRYGSQARLSLTTDEVNNSQIDRMVALVEKHLGKVSGKSIAILGLTYKPDTDVVEESAAVKIASRLLKKGARLAVYDPAGMQNARKGLGEKGIKYAASAGDCLQGADFCILATPWSEFKSLKPGDFITNMREPALLDCWRIFDRAEFSPGVKYLAIGLSSG